MSPDENNSSNSPADPKRAVLREDGGADPGEPIAAAESSGPSHPVAGRLLKVFGVILVVLAVLAAAAFFYARNRLHTAMVDNLPRLDGREVLARIKSDQSLRQIPVVVLTTSDAEEDVLRSYDLHANAYVTKPIDIDEFLAAIRSLGDFWLAVVQLPRP